MCCYLAALAMLSSCGLEIYANSNDDKNDAPKPLARETVKAWRGVGANVGWMKMELGDNRPTFQVEGQGSGITVFQFTEWKEGVLAKMPDPGMPFGLDLNLTKMTDQGLKELVGLKSLQALYLAGTQVTDEGLKDLAGRKSLLTLDVRWTKVTVTGLKELAGLTTLQRLYLNHCGVTDAGIKELSRLKNLQILNISASEVTDAGLKEVAGLKNLQSLIMWGTKATPAGVAELRKELPKCRIVDQ
jgi:Leucine-rich repeat (LRR) protein